MPCFFASLRWWRTRKKQPTAKSATMMMNPMIGSTMTRARFLMPCNSPAVADDEYSAVVVGRALVLKIAVGAMANGFPSSVWKWQLYLTASTTGCS